MTDKTSLTYSDAGVNIDAGNALVQNIKPFAKSTHNAQVLGGIGGFAGAYALPSGYQEPVMIACTDGVGTKLKLAKDMDIMEGIGIDCVAMCVNDMIVTGAKPLFFLDYYACGELNVLEATHVIKGIAKGCEQSDCALLGGETAELPGLLPKGDFDIAGFAVGVVEKSKMITGELIASGDPLIAIASSGPHSNGYSLIRKLIETQSTLNTQLSAHETLGEALIKPTAIYVKLLLPLIEKGLINGMSHITGGGLLENTPRMLPDDLAADLELQTWDWPMVFHWIQNAGHISDAEMLKTFNCGVGMVLAVKQESVDAVLEHCKVNDTQAWVIGRVRDHVADIPRVRFA